jgi:hypothetical protein
VAPDSGTRSDGDRLTDTDLTQPMRIPTGTMSAAERAAAQAAQSAPAGQVRQRTVDTDKEITAVIDISGMAKDGAKDGDGK